MKCLRCGPLIKAIDAYLAKAENDLYEQLTMEGYLKAKESLNTVDEIEEVVTKLLEDNADDLLKELADALVSGADLRGSDAIAKHADWAEELKTRYTFTADNVEGILQDEVGKVFARVLQDAGVYKCTPEGRTAFCKFIRSVS